MKTFSEYLSAYVAERRISLQKASLLCDMDRTVLSRYVSGKRLPENMGKVEKIARGLEMSSRQTKELKILYRLSKADNCQCKALEFMEQIFCGWDDCPFIMPDYQKTQRNWLEVKMQRLSGMKEVCAAASWIAKTSSELRLQTAGMAEGALLASVLAEADCRIEHMISVGYGQNGEAAAKKLERMLPFLLLGKEYRVYCHYQGFQEEPPDGMGMQVMLGNQGILLFSEDFARGLFTRRTEYREYYEQMYLQNMKECFVFGGSSPYKQQGIFQENKFLKNPFSGTVFACQDEPRERIWVKMGGHLCKSFFVEETELVKLFQIFLKYAKMWGGSMEGGQKN